MQVWYSFKNNSLFLSENSLWQIFREMESVVGEGKYFKKVEKESDNSGRVYLQNGDVMEFMGEL